MQWEVDIEGLQNTVWHGLCFQNQFTFFLFFLKREGFLFIYLFIYLFLAVFGLRFVRGLSLVVASGGHSSSRCAGLSLSRRHLLQGTGSRCASSVIVAHGPSCSTACGIFPDQGSNPCPLRWQADSQPLRHQGSPQFTFLKVCIISLFSLRLHCINFLEFLKYLHVIFSLYGLIFCHLSTWMEISGLNFSLCPILMLSCF